MKRVARRGGGGSSPQWSRWLPIYAREMICLGKKVKRIFPHTGHRSPPSLMSLRRVYDDGSPPEFSDKRGFWFGWSSWWGKSGQNSLKNNSFPKNNLAIMKLFVKSTAFLANLAKFPVGHCS